MAIFIPGKDGDAMGNVAFTRMNKKQRMEFAIAKRAEEERRDNADFYKTQRAAAKFKEVVRKQRKDAGLE